MPTTPQAFRTMVRDSLADINTSGVMEFSDKQIDSWRDIEVGLLYSRGLFRRTTTRGGVGDDAEVEIVSATGDNGATYITRYYTLPTGFRKVLGIEFIDSDTDQPVFQSNDWTDNEEPGHIRIDDVNHGLNKKIRVFGEKEYSSVADTAMRAEVIEVLKRAVCVQAIASELAKRVRFSRSQQGTRNTDATAGQITGAVQTARLLLKDSLTAALSIQARSVLGQ